MTYNFGPKPQPDAAQYSTSELDMSPRLNRDLFRQMFGVQAPAWDQARRIQRWFDPAAAGMEPDAPYQYIVNVLKDGKVIEVKKYLTNREASTPNLPGKFEYPKYVRTPTSAFCYRYNEQGVVSGTVTVNPDILSSMQEADALKAELEAVGCIVLGVTETQYGGPFKVNYPSDEPRRIFNVLVGDTAQNVQALLISRNLNGVGSPGGWVKGEFGEVVWVSAIAPETGEQDPRPEVEIPQRSLLPNERLVGGFGGIIHVEKTDAAATVAGDDRDLVPARVKEILKRVSQLQRDLTGK